MLSRQRGFTLIDLLFIAVILSVTAAALFPVLEAAKEKDRSATCLYNLKLCAQALKMYTDDYDGTMPSSGVVAPSPTQAQVIDFLTGIGDPYPKPYGAPAKTWPQFLQDHMKTYGIAFCPSDRPRSRVSYWYKYANDLAWRDPLLRKRKTGDYGYESDQIAFYEHAALHTGDAAGTKNGVKINVSFLDTHVDTITVASGPTAYPPATDERSGASAIRLGLPMYYNCRDENGIPDTIHSPGDFIDPSSCYDKL